MSTSGSYTYTIVLNDLVNTAFRLLGVFNQDATPPATDIANATEALNLMIKQYMSEGKPLWCIEDISLPLVQGLGTIQNPYILGPNGNFSTYKPLKIEYARLYTQASSGNPIDIPLQEMSRQEYNMLGSKYEQGTPNSFYFDPQTTYANFCLYVTADAYNTANNSVILTVQRPLQDMINPTDNFDFPIECLNAIKWGLAAELCFEYDVPTAKAQGIMAKAQQYKDNMFNFSQEEAPVYFTPAPNRR